MKLIGDEIPLIPNVKPSYIRFSVKSITSGFMKIWSPDASRSLVK